MFYDSMTDSVISGRGAAQGWLSRGNRRTTRPGAALGHRTPGVQLLMLGRVRHSESLRLRLENSIAVSAHSPPITMRNEILFSPHFFPETSLNSEKASRKPRKWEWWR